MKTCHSCFVSVTPKFGQMGNSSPYSPNYNSLTTGLDADDVINCTDFCHRTVFEPSKKAKMAAKTTEIRLEKDEYNQKEKKYGTLHEFACHPCAGAMLIFSVSFQF